MSKRKQPSSDGNPNHDICELLTELANYERNVTRDIHKYNAYRKAARTLAAHPTRITSGDEARKLPGVGLKIGKKIDEILQTGKLQKLENIHEDKTVTIINLLTRVTGIGPAKAKVLAESGVTSIEDLEKRKAELGLTHHQLIGLKYFDDFEKKIPRDEIVEIEKFITEKIHKLDPEFLVTICGSYRRGRPESGDIDVLLTHPSFTSKQGSKPKSHLLQSVVTMLQEENLITDTLSLGDIKFMGACSIRQAKGEKEIGPVRRLDIRLTPHDQYHCSVLYFTGSDIFNQNMRQHALSEGFTLNEYSIRPVGSTGIPGEPLEITSEKDIFDIIDYPYKAATERD